MIAFIEGILEEKEPTRVLVNVHGVGYEASIPLSSYDRLPALGQPVRLLTTLVVREDAQLLYGFTTPEERSTFHQLTSISGIGPKLGLAVLSGIPVRDLRVAVANGDIKRLSSITGIGKKTAERLILEMRDKLGKGDLMEAVTGGHAGPHDGKLRDLLLALLSLGHKQADAQRLVKDLAPSITPDTTLEELLRLALSGKKS